MIVKILKTLLCLLALLAFAAVALAEGIPYEAVLTASTWTSADTGSELTFNEDGTGRLVSTGVDTETAWVLDGMAVTITYSFYGERSLVYTLTPGEENWILGNESNPAAYVGPAIENQPAAEPEATEPEAVEPEPAEAPAETPAEPEAHERTPYGSTIVLGDGLYLETVEMTFAETGETKQIFSNGTGEGAFETREPSEGNTYYYVNGDFTVLLDYDVDIRNIYGEFFFDDGASVYKADFAPIVPDAETFEYNVLSSKDIGTIGHCVFCEIPDEMAGKYTSCVLKLGFTDEFDYKMAINGAYEYRRLDDVFYVILEADPTAEYSDTETIKALQAALNEAGYECGTPDGVAGRNTASAISAYQAANGLNETGTATFETLTSLGIIPAISY